VPEGPGLNDNGSGSTSLLEILLTMYNTVRVPPHPTHNTHNTPTLSPSTPLTHILHQQQIEGIQSCQQNPIRLVGCRGDWTVGFLLLCARVENQRKRSLAHPHSTPLALTHIHLTHTHNSTHAYFFSHTHPLYLCFADPPLFFLANC